MEMLDMIAAERRRVADFLDGLTPEQWGQPSLCGEWTVRDVAAHLTAGWNVSKPKFALAMVRHLGFDGANAAFAKELAKRPTSEIIDDLRRHADHPFSPPVVGIVGQLVDVIAHGQDMARPLGIELTVETEHVRPALGVAVSPKSRLLASPKLRQGLRFEATDQSWSSGEGPVVEGDSTSLLLALLGRAAENDGLDGPGAEMLRRRLH